ncbi:Amino acid transporter [Aspergillus mulundensis]|uniref:Amino acid transporter n=1 Tax=Aspergillus mulundensis TaxID=1810919 RepID=A0A3D8T5I0_9EURO|nr:Amino acid transporter [Aspergillus mulundensis]RDW93817.1 Amino acid transporter [Aspergillus mulundensis]
MSPKSDLEKSNTNDAEVQASPVLTTGSGLHRRLGNRQIQLIAIGGSIGTAVFVSIGAGLAKGGPGSLLIAYFFYCCFLAMVNNCLTEMSVYQPVEGGFIRLAGKWVDDAWGFMAGWNFFLYEALLIPFEITAINIVLTYWRTDIPVWAVCLACVILYGLLNVLAVKAYGESEFWLSGGKVILILMLFAFTFVTMVGGNPQHDAYGFRNWNEPGAFAEYLSTGNLGRFEGFLACVWSAGFACVGPEYISMVAAEAKHPRKYIKAAFATVYFRFIVFFIGSALCCGIVVSYADPVLRDVQLGSGEGAGTASASPYVIAMKNMSIEGLPHVVNALLITSIFSAGNTYTFTATRILHSLALEGRAPRILRKCTKQGVPIYCFCVVMIFPFLSFLQMGDSSSTVLTWLTNIITAAGIINYVVITVTYIAFYRATVAQGFDRSKLPYTGWFQPYCGYIGLAWMFTVVCCFGYESFTPWSVDKFFTNYTMVLLAPILFLGWKLIRRTTFVRPHEADLIWEAPEIDRYEEELSLVEPPVGFWQEMVGSSFWRKLRRN